MHRGDIGSKYGPKPPLLDERRRENLVILWSLSLLKKLEPVSFLNLNVKYVFDPYKYSEFCF